MRGNFDKKEGTEDGNFAYFVNVKSTFHEDLKDHLDHASSNSKYICPGYRMKSSVFLKNLFVRKSCHAFQSTGVTWQMKHRTVPQVSVCVRYINTIGEMLLDSLNSKTLRWMPKI